MEKKEFSIDIKAPKEKIWEMLWSDDGYRKWSDAFMEGSYVKSDWKEGGKALFLTPDGEGMYSIIAKNTPNEYMSFKHLGIVKEMKEQPIDEETRKWSGAMENYRLSENDGMTRLTVDVEVSGEEWEKMVIDSFPKALEKVKQLSENNKV